MSGFAQAIPHLLELEGGFVNDPADRGGATNMGVTQRTLDAWRKKNRLAPKSVADITREEAEAIYHQEYWVRGMCDALPWPISFLHFDACVHSGPKNAARMLQRVLGVPDDGVVGPLTLWAAKLHHLTYWVPELLLERMDFLRDIANRDASQRKFLRGWMNRIGKLRALTHVRPMVPTRPG